MKTKLKTRIKICGIRSPEEIELAALYGADAVGFITEVPVESPRKLDSDTAASLVSEVPRCLDSVLVIMPENSSRALELIEKVRPDIVQIHSNAASFRTRNNKGKNGYSYYNDSFHTCTG